MMDPEVTTCNHAALFCSPELTAVYQASRDLYRGYKKPKKSLGLDTVSNYKK